MKIVSDFDGGSITVLGDPDARTVSLALRPDSAADFRQWFCFRSIGEAGEPRRFRIEDAGESKYPDAWDDYRVCASYDGESWFRVATRYDGSALRFAHRPSRRIVTYAAFAPYPHARLRRLVGRAVRSPRARVEVVGATAMGRELTAIRFGQESASALRVWIIARQHPGETMAAWCAEGITLRLLDEEDAGAAALLEDAVVTVVPCVNIDGGVLGNHRTNAAGRDLNRSWDAPDAESCPEVLALRSAIVESGVDLFLDLHGDESYRYAFAAGCEGNPGYSERLAALETTFRECLEAGDSSFHVEGGYDRDEPGAAIMGCASNWVGQRFDCLALTLEMPFKDDADHPDPRRGWTPDNARRFGSAVLDAALLALPSLR